MVGGGGPLCLGLHLGGGMLGGASSCCLFVHSASDECPMLEPVS